MKTILRTILLTIPLLTILFTACGEDEVPPVTPPPTEKDELIVAEKDRILTFGADELESRTIKVETNVEAGFVVSPATDENFTVDYDKESITITPKAENTDHDKKKILTLTITAGEADPVEISVIQLEADAPYFRLETNRLDFEYNGEVFAIVEVYTNLPEFFAKADVNWINVEPFFDDENYLVVRVLETPKKDREGKITVEAEGFTEEIDVIQRGSNDYILALTGGSTGLSDLMKTAHDLELIFESDYPDRLNYFIESVDGFADGDIILELSDPVEKADPESGFISYFSTLDIQISENTTGLPRNAVLKVGISEEKIEKYITVRINQRSGFEDILFSGLWEVEVTYVQGYSMVEPEDYYDKWETTTQTWKIIPETATRYRVEGVFDNLFFYFDSYGEDYTWMIHTMNTWTDPETEVVYRQRITGYNNREGNYPIVFTINQNQKISYIEPDDNGGHHGLSFGHIKTGSYDWYALWFNRTDSAEALYGIRFQMDKIE